MQEFEITLETAPEKTELVLIPEQTKLEQIAKQYQKNYSDRIVLACVDGKLRELSKVVKAPGKISFLTMTDRDGKRTYRRSMTLLLQKAVENLWKDQVKIRVYYSLGESYYCELLELQMISSRAGTARRDAASGRGRFTDQEMQCKNRRCGTAVS